MIRVLVVGAGGTLGRRVVSLFRSELPSAFCVPAARRGARLGPGGRSLDLFDSAALRSALSEFDLLINAVGPYHYDPTPVLACCADAGCHYTDLAELPEFIAAVDEAWRSRFAGAGVVALSGCSTSPALIEILAQRFAGHPGLARVEAWLSIGTDNPPSAALLYGLLRPMGRALPDGGEAFAATEHRIARDGSRLSYGRYPFPRGDGCASLAGRRVLVQFFAGFDRALLVSALRRAAPLLSRVPDDALARLARWCVPAARMARRFGGARGRLALDARGTGGELLGSLEVEAPRRGLDVPALPVVWLAERLAGVDPLPTGGFPELIPADFALGGLRAIGCEVFESAGDAPGGGPRS